MIPQLKKDEYYINGTVYQFRQYKESAIIGIRYVLEVKVNDKWELVFVSLYGLTIKGQRDKVHEYLTQITEQ